MPRICPPVRLSVCLFMSRTRATPLAPLDYGTVLRMQPDLKVSPNQPAPNTVGEWKSMGHTNFLLSASRPLFLPPFPSLPLFTY